MTINRISNWMFARVAPVAAVLTSIFSFGGSATAANVTLAWNPNSETNLVGYILHYGTASSSYTGRVTVGSTTTNATVSNLQNGQTYYFAVTATNATGLLSPYSAEVSYTVPVPNTAPVANNQSIATAEDAAKAVTLTGSDADGNSLTYTVLTTPAHGTLSGTVPSLTYTPAANYSGSDSFTFRVSDGIANSATATVSITVTAVNDTPVANAQSVSTSEDTARAITLTGSDPDGNTLTFAVVAVPTHGTLSGVAPSPTYTPAANYTGTDSFTFKVNDGTVDSPTATVSLTVSTVNDTPVASAQSVTTAEDTAKAITLSGSDVDGNTLTYAIVTSPAHGALSGTAPNLTYTPAANYNGADSFSFRVNDGTVNSATATVSISVTPVNDAPVASAQSVITAEGAAKAITLAASDADGDTLTYAVVASPAHGTLSGTAPNLTYTPAANYNGADSLTFRVNDGATNSATATVSISVTPVNNAPVASAQSVTTAEDTAKAISLTGTDADGDTLTYSVATQPAHGTLSGTVPNLTYTPAANYNGSDSFTFRANDGTTNSAAATVSLTVTAVNDTPVANAQSVSTSEDTAKAVTLTGSDVDSDALTFSVVAAPAHGTLSGVAPNLTYTPTANYTGADSFTFKVNDGTVDSATALVSLNVTAVNDAPVASAQSVTTAEDTAKAITLSGSDPDGNTLTYAIVASPAHGTLSGSAPNVTYTPATNYNGSDSFSFKVNDGTTDSPAATVSLTVTPVNDAPMALAQTVATDRNTAKALTLTGSDVDGDSLTYAVATSPTKGVLSGTAPNLTYTPNNNVTGADSFTFRVNDGTVNSATANISINIAQGPNTPPIASAQSVTTAEDTAKAISLTGTDADADTLTFSVATQPAHGTLSGTVPNLTYTPAANYNGSDSFTFRANDGTTNSAAATVSLTVTAVNDTPVANAQSVSTSEDTAKAITLTGSDPDGNTLTFAVVAAPAHGTLSGVAPSLTYTPAANYTGTDSFTFKVNDGTVDSPTATVSLTVSTVNDAPVASAQSVTTPEDTAKAIVLSATDIDGNALTYAITTPPAHGTLSGTAPNLTYTPATNYNGADSFAFKVNDGTVDSPAATVSLTVTPVNDAPTLNSIASVAVSENSSESSVALSGISAGPGETQTLSITSTSSDPALVPTPTVTYSSPSSSGSLTFAPVAGATGSAVITVTVNDGQTANNTVSQSFTVTVDAITSPITLDPIADMTVDESAPQQTVALTGISAKSGTTSTAITTGNLTPWLQTVVDRLNKNKVAAISVTAASSNTRLIPTPVVAYTSPNDKGTLSFAPVAGASGKATISVTVSDGQSTPASRSFQVTVQAGNRPPTLDALANLTVNRNAGLQNVALTGISPGSDELQPLTITATSSNPGLIPNPLVTYSDPSSTGSLTFAPVTNASGTAIITVQVNDGQADNNLTSRSFTVTVSSETLQPAIVLTSPVAGSSYGSPAAIKLTASVSTYGRSISKVQFFAGAALLGEDASAPYVFDWDCETAGSYNLVARALYDGGSADSSAVTITVTDSGLPVPWETADVGPVSTPGNVVVDQDQFTVQGAGRIEGTDDSFRFVYQPLTADGEIWVNVATLPAAETDACAGIMIRESLSSASRFVFVGKLPDGNLQVRSRSTTGGDVATQIVSGGKPSPWLRLVRKGDLFVAGYGKKVGTWSIGSLLNVSMASNIYIGMAVDSGDPSKLNGATFATPTVTP